MSSSSVIATGPDNYNMHAGMMHHGALMSQSSAAARLDCLNSSTRVSRALVQWDLERDVSGVEWKKLRGRQLLGLTDIARVNSIYCCLISGSVNSGLHD